VHKKRRDVILSVNTPKEKEKQGSRPEQTLGGENLRGLKRYRCTLIGFLITTAKEKSNVRSFSITQGRRNFRRVKIAGDIIRAGV